MPSPSGPRDSAPHTSPTSVRVSSIQVRGLMEAIEQSGKSPTQFIAQAGIDAELLRDPESWFSLERFDELMIAACEFCDDPAFGLHWGERSPMMQFDLAPPLFASAPTLEAAVACLHLVQPLLSSRTEIHYSQQRNRCLFSFDVLASSPRGRCTRSEAVIAGMTRLFRYLGVEDAIRSIQFDYARPSHGAEYDRVFGELVRFAQPSPCIEFASSALTQPQPHRNLQLHELLYERTEQLRQRALGQLSYAEQLEQRIRASLPELLSMTDAARALGISERSLRRRLAAEKISYSDLVERVQHRLADELLGLGTKSVKEIAHALGFNSVSGFHRAYRRWTGRTPALARSPRARQ